MRVESTDALSMNLNKSYITPEAANETKDTRSSVLNKKNISQMTEFDKKSLPIGEQILISAIEKANKALSGSNRHFEISIHEKTNNIMVRVIDSETNQVVREIPPEKILDLIANLWELAGLIVDERR
jgi:flagellar protein FlaG